MNSHALVAEGNQFRANHQPQRALECYAQAFVSDPENAHAWNNYGNVLRECGWPSRAVPFLQHAIALDPKNSTALFNLAVAYLAMGDWQQGWQWYEHRWNFEHLAGTLPQYTAPRWTGQDLQNKTIFVLGEQGHGDNIQFVRYLYNLHVAGARIVYSTTAGLVPLLGRNSIVNQVITHGDAVPEFDYWTPMMSLPGVLGVNLSNMPRAISYINPDADLARQWQDRLGPKRRMRVGFAWSGRKDNWLNEHKGMPFETMLTVIRSHPELEWINLQADATADQEAVLAQAGVSVFANSITNFADTAALVSHCDVVISVDTAVAHLSGALGRPTWLMLNWFAACWRWLVQRDDSPWYPTMRIFRQPQQDDWAAVTARVSQHLRWFKV